MKQELPYRGIFQTADGRTYRLDFYATSRAFARAHANQLAHDTLSRHELKTDSPLTVTHVGRLGWIDRGTAGSFYAQEAR